VRLRCGGLPQRPRGPLGYQLTFSIAGLTNEYLGEAEVLRSGRRLLLPTLDELEELNLPEPLGRCEAFTTSGATSTLPRTYQGRLRELDYKTVRRRGHCAKVRAMRDLGLLSDEPVVVPGGRVRPRDVFHAVAETALAGDGPDLLVLRAEASGRHQGRARRRRIEILDLQDEATGLTAMQRMTGFPAAMVAQALARGEAEPGAKPLELALPAAPLVDGLAARGIHPRDVWLDD
jgi:lysine 6-dehydrogenase